VRALLAAAAPTIGGQAVLEGVLMRSPQSFAVAVRKPDGAIVVREEPWLSFSARYPILKKPILRGATMLVESMTNGMSALTWSAEIAEGAEHKPTTRGALAVTVGVSLLMAFALFKGAPHALATLLGLRVDQALFHVVDGVAKLLIFVGYVLAISRLKDVQRLFGYHGAEHMTVHAYEKQLPLDVAHAREQSTAHPRCGTSLILLVLASSFVVFAVVLPFVPRVSDSDLLQSAFALLLKAPLMLPVAGVAYELQRAAAKRPDHPLVRLFIAPGMLLQRLTTRRPDDRQLEVALAALHATLVREGLRQEPELRKAA
jgi:uncharacterized protein YqhQ